MNYLNLLMDISKYSIDNNFNKPLTRLFSYLQLSNHSTLFHQTKLYPYKLIFDY
jgi:hypothetical protein